jgi:hypothetical protein
VAIVGAGLLALAPLLAILPKGGLDGVVLASPIFDHSKIAMTAEMMRAGLPAANPFFSETGIPERVSYYYLWHFSAAAMALASDVTAWEADAALTWFTAFASALVVIGFAIWIGGRPSAGLLAVAIAASATIRPILERLFGTEETYSAVRWSTGFGSWLFQVSWAPQHVAAATSVVLAVYVLAQLPARREPWLVVVLALLAAAGFQSSVWVGLAFALAALLMAATMLWNLQTSERGPFLMSAAVAGLLAIVLATPFLYDQITTIAVRDAGSPITIAPVQVLGDAFSPTVRRVLDLPAYWLVYLPLEFPAFYPAGVVMLILMLRNASTDAGRRRIMQGLALLAATSLVVAWLLVSDLGGNNDLGWRAVLPAVLLLMAFAAAGISHWLAAGARAPAILAFLGLLIGLPNGMSIMAENTVVSPRASGIAFANSPAMWEAVRRHSSPHQRVANNPSFLDGLTPWPVNISWALLADRRSCYAGYNLAIAFAPVSAARRAEIDRRFNRVFEGKPEADDLLQMADRHHCELVVVTAQDGAWRRDPFASSAAYRLVESRSDAWRIYRKVGSR